MKIQLWNTDRPIPYARNARKIGQSAIDKVAASIKEFGWQQPIVVDGEGVIIAGHTRLLAAQKLGLKEVPVHMATGLTAAQVKAYRLMDNRSHQEASWDVDLIAPELEEIQALGFDELTLTGFDVPEIEKLLKLTEADTAPLDREAPEEFNEYGEDIDTDYKCPKCSYAWSGKPK
jgi:ParB-like chromosome segregation protein Spo0J